MGVTDNLELNTITESDNPTVAEFFQKLAGSANNSNMEIIDDEFEKYAKIDDLDSTGAVREAGGIVPYVDYVAQTESDVLVVTMTYTNGFECDVSFAQITSAYNSGKTCMLYANTGTNGGNKCVYMLGYLDGDQAIFTAVAESQLYQFRIGSDNTITFSQTSLGTVTNISDSVTTESSETAASSTAVKTAYDAAMAAVQSSEKGAANGVAPLNASKKVDSTYLPTIPSLSTSVTSTSTSTAATSSAVKQAYDLASSATTPITGTTIVTAESSWFSSSSGSANYRILNNVVFMDFEVKLTIDSSSNLTIYNMEFDVYTPTPFTSGCVMGSISSIKWTGSGPHCSASFQTLSTSFIRVKCLSSMNSTIPSGDTVTITGSLLYYL